MKTTTNTSHHKGQKKEKEWFEVDSYRFSIHSEDMFSKDAKEIPVIVFINKNTAELKIFARNMAERIGIYNLKF